MYCYNLTTWTILYYDTLTSLTTSNAYNFVQRAAVLYTNATSDYIIFVNGPNGDIYIYDVVNMFDQIFDNSLDLDDPCLTKYTFSGGDTELYLVNLDESFYVYDFSSNSWTTASSLNYGRTYVTCIVNDFVSNNPKLYAIGGNDEIIEFMTVNTATTSSWGLFNATLENIAGGGINYKSASDMTIITYGRYIFLIGGYDTNYEEDVTVINVAKETVKYDSDFILGVDGLGAIIANQRVFIFGGYDGSGMCLYFLETVCCKYWFA